MAKENINISDFAKKLKENPRYKEPFKNFQETLKTIDNLDDKDLQKSNTKDGGYYDKKQMTEQLIVATHVWMDQIDKGIYKEKPPVEVEQLQSRVKVFKVDISEKFQKNPQYKEPIQNLTDTLKVINKSGEKLENKRKMVDQLQKATLEWMKQIDKGTYQGKPSVELEKSQSGTKEINISEFVKKLESDLKYKECLDNFKDTLKSMDKLNDKKLQEYSDSSNPKGFTNHYDKQQMTEQLIAATDVWMDQIDKGTYHKQEPLPKEVEKNSQGIFARAWSAVKNLVNSIVDAGSKMISNHHDKNEILKIVIYRKVKKSLMEEQKNISKTHETPIAEKKENIKNNINKFTTSTSKQVHGSITPTTGSTNKVNNKPTELKR